MNRLAARMLKLEGATIFRRAPYVIHRTAADAHLFAFCRAIGRRVIVVPLPCRSVDEWLARYAPQEAATR